MATAKIDANRKPTLIGVSKNDPEIPTRVAADPTTGELLVQQSEKVPTDSTRTNGSYVLSFNAAGDCVYVDETIAGITYRTTFTRSDMVVSTTLPISAVVQL
jgi:hypothetical protein